MKRLKSMHYLFIVLNIAAIYLEYHCLNQWIFQDAFNFSSQVSLTITLTIFIFLTIMTLYAMLRKRDVFDASKDAIPEEVQAMVASLKEIYEEKTNQTVDIVFADGALTPAVMFAKQKTIYINTNKRYTYTMIDSAHFKGVLAHELGHVIHMPMVYILANMRLTGILGNFFLVLAYRYSSVLKKKKHRIFNYAGFGLLYLMFILLNLINIITLYPFKRYEEKMADQISLLFDSGYALKGYYYKLAKNHQSKLDRFRFKWIDFNHLGPQKHYDLMNQNIETLDLTCELVGDHQIFVYQYKDRLDQATKIVRFYEKNIDKSISSMYLYIARNYELIQEISAAKKYYMQAGEHNQPLGYKALAKLYIKEGNLEEAMHSYHLLANMNDVLGTMMITYFEKTFVLDSMMIDGVKMPSEEIHALVNASLILHLDGRFEQTIEESEVIGVYKRKGNHVTLVTEDTSKSMTYTLKDDLIISQVYSMYVQTLDQVFKVKDIYKAK